MDLWHSADIVSSVAPLGISASSGGRLAVVLVSTTVSMGTLQRGPTVRVLLDDVHPPKLQGPVALLTLTRSP